MFVDAHPLATGAPMPLHPATTGFLRFLHDNRAIRDQIRAGHDRTLLYAGWNPNTIGGRLGYQQYEKRVYHEILARERQHPELQHKEILTDVLERVPAPGTPHPNLMEFAHHVEREVGGSRNDLDVLWRTLSGIFASNASGAVSFYLGTRVEAGQFVFTNTEIPVLMRNPHVDQTTKDMLAYYDRCLKNGEQLTVSLARA
jgi:hypothetical protein